MILPSTSATHSHGCNLDLVRFKFPSCLKSENILHTYHNPFIFVQFVLFLNVNNFPRGFMQKGEISPIFFFSWIFLPSLRPPQPMPNADFTWMSHWCLITTGPKINSTSLPQTCSPSCVPYLRSRCPQLSF